MRQNEPLYVISVAARLLELHPQTLRKYEREGFVSPSRTAGNLRLYSSSDIERLRQVKYLVERRGINLSGVQLAMDVTRRLRGIRREVQSLSDRNNGRLAYLVREIDALLELLGTSPDVE
ncbi:heat shock protein transcriptional repressor HspR [Sphaerobacter thermophilus]|uniref:Transcriptional regulator, MerR family n=1 Tax=Sphaerobacter thermophilus (strain ATCC 49802 / DSM 20745 / KCCM 41009 / NCIMB 13125 / S 6022) TaxID=479434 RepID=D1C7P6_SPHTD|nr:MerR family transcriptional regulator [Sphaerobacter thermophilus]ACZ37879.1 transcriptional regulator, MerR family [Sphaerobacter thermophilus DSM 20745]